MFTTLALHVVLVAVHRHVGLGVWIYTMQGHLFLTRVKYRCFGSKRTPKRPKTTIEVCNATKGQNITFDEAKHINVSPTEDAFF